MAIKHMSLAWISVSDFKRSQKFFTEILGLKVNNLAEEYSWAELSGHEGGAILGIGECNEPGPVMPGQNAVMTMSVDNIEQSIVELRAKGVNFIGDVIEVPGHVKMIFFADPDNNKFQLVESLDGK